MYCKHSKYYTLLELQFLSPFPVLEFANIPCKVAGSVPTGSGDGELTLEDHVSRADRRVMSRSTCYSLIAASEALKQAGWAPGTEDQRCYTGNARVTNYILLNLKFNIIFGMKILFEIRLPMVEECDWAQT